ncbi:hypothetical protein ARMSODRAFT_67011 [Armillaria solidipes]|uniref:Uncharacterized protein n=1 Tax=Armillaria solidipes TaxID=1076256 RepID=A0A2H3BYT2_9AGAR|nr:hypothetical protein ARMSODRAFT_67011 [Armillaria solidipes]
MPAIVDIFKRPLVIWDAVCRALNAAEDHVTMVWVSEAFVAERLRGPCTISNHSVSVILCSTSSISSILSKKIRISSSENSRRV